MRAQQQVRAAARPVALSPNRRCAAHVSPLLPPPTAGEAFKRFLPRKMEPEEGSAATCERCHSRATQMTMTSDARRASCTAPSLRGVRGEAGGAGGARADEASRRTPRTGVLRAHIRLCSLAWLTLTCLIRSFFRFRAAARRLRSGATAVGGHSALSARTSKSKIEACDARSRNSRSIARVCARGGGSRPRAAAADTSGGQVNGHHNGRSPGSLQLTRRWAGRRRRAAARCARRHAGRS